MNEATFTSELLNKLDETHSEEELRTLCSRLDIDYENLGGRGKLANTRELIEKLQRDGRLQELIDDLKKTRSNTEWPMPVGCSSQQNQKEDNQNDIGYIGGDQIGRDKITVGDIIGSKGVAIGAGAQAYVYEYELRGSQQTQEIRNRRQLIQNVKSTWIQGVLNQALHKSAWIELGLQLEPEQVNRPLHMTWESDTKQQIVPLFREQVANTLLILGKPGSGKTVTLLDLARQLLAEVEQDLVAPIPVVFNLSSWALKQQTLHDWLLVELDTLYSVPKKTGHRWLEQDALVLLLDGLDEVAEAHRQACVEAINTYREEHGLTGIVVCSRSEEYAALTNKLDLLGAVVIQPLTSEQADSYLQRMGLQLAAVQALLREDEVLQEWVRSPLFLYVVAMAYRGLSEEQLRSTHTGNLNRLYDAYVSQMLESHRQYPEAPYPPGHTQKWLAYLAARLVERDLTVYLIENMQPDWLVPRDGQPSNSSMKERLLRRVVGKEEIEITDTQWSWTAAVAGVKYRLGKRLRDGQFMEPLVLLLFVPLIGLRSGLSEGNVRSQEKPNQGVWRSLRNGLLSVPSLGLLIVLGAVLRFVLGGGLSDFRILGLSSVLSIPLLSVLFVVVNAVLSVMLIDKIT